MTICEVELGMKMTLGIPKVFEAYATANPVQGGSLVSNPSVNLLFRFTCISSGAADQLFRSRP